EVEIGCGLLDILEIELLERPYPPDRGGYAPAHVGVDPDLDLAAHRCTDCGEGVAVLAQVAADLEFELGEAAVHEVRRLLSVALGGVDEQVAGRRGVVPAEASQQLCDRHAEELALGIEQGHLEAGDGIGADLTPVAAELLHAVHEPVDPAWILSQQELGQLTFYDRADGGERRSGALTEASQTFVGLQLDEQAGRGVSSAACPQKRLLQGNADLGGLDSGDPHSLTAHWRNSLQALLG